VVQPVHTHLLSPWAESKHCICDQKTVTGLAHYVVTVGNYVEELYLP